MHVTISKILPCLAMALPVAALADEAAEQIVQEALPVMHYTCASIAEEADGDEVYIFEVVAKMTALSLYNRQIDIEEHAPSDADKAKLRDVFVAELAAGCAEDKDALLGGVVDTAVKSTLSQ